MFGISGNVLCGKCFSFPCNCWQQAWSVPTPLYTVQRCPVCEGRGAVAANFYTRFMVAGSTADLMSGEQCRTCDGKGILRVSLLGSIEKVL